MKKQAKTKRFHIRVHPELKERVEDISDDLGKTSSKFITDILWKVVLSPKDYFVCCPTCGQTLFDVEEIPLAEGVQKEVCKKGHVHYYDFEVNEFIK